MKQYTVRSGQNLYDVALTLYGSIEGIFDLLVCNGEVSLNSSLKHGQVLNYNEEFIIEHSIPDWFKNHSVIVKNGCHSFKNTSVTELIGNFIRSQNDTVARKFKTGELSFDFNVPEPVKKQQFWEDGNGNIIIITPPKPKIERGIFPYGSGKEKWSDASISDDVLALGDLRERLQTIIGVDIGEEDYSDYVLNVNLIPAFTAGMILSPLLSYDEDTFFSQLATPKIIIHQNGSSSSFGVQIASNRLLAVDWGDGSDLSYAWFNQSRQDISHQYSNNANHTIKIYGNAEYVNLDFTNLNGTYCALENIYIDRLFITLYPNAEKLNGLFIIKQDTNE